MTLKKILYNYAWKKLTNVSTKLLHVTLWAPQIPWKWSDHLKLMVTFRIIYIERGLCKCIMQPH